MRTNRQNLLLDASPLIYLAKVDAMDVVAAAGYRAAIPTSVARECTEGGVAYRHADAAAISEAIRAGALEVVEPTSGESDEARRISVAAPGVHAGECDVLAVAIARGCPVSITERRAGRLARSLGLRVVHPLELLFVGIGDADRLESTTRRYAELVEMRLDELDRLMTQIEGRRRR